MMTNHDKKREREKIEMRVLAGLKSGKSLELTPQMRQELRRALQDRHRNTPHSKPRAATPAS